MSTQEPRPILELAADQAFLVRVLEDAQCARAYETAGVAYLTFAAEACFVHYSEVTNAITLVSPEWCSILTLKDCLRLREIGCPSCYDLMEKTLKEFGS